MEGRYCAHEALVGAISPGGSREVSVSVVEGAGALDTIGAWVPSALAVAHGATVPEGPIGGTPRIPADAVAQGAWVPPAGSFPPVRGPDAVCMDDGGGMAFGS